MTDFLLPHLQTKLGVYRSFAVCFYQPESDKTKFSIGNPSAISISSLCVFYFNFTDESKINAEVKEVKNNECTYNITLLLFA